MTIGRPRLYDGETPLERNTARRRALVAAGGRFVQVGLSAPAVAQLARVREALGAATDAEAVTLALGIAEATLGRKRGAGERTD